MALWKLGTDCQNSTRCFTSKVFARIHLTLRTSCVTTSYKINRLFEANVTEVPFTCTMIIIFYPMTSSQTLTPAVNREVNLKTNGYMRNLRKSQEESSFFMSPCLGQLKVQLFQIRLYGEAQKKGGPCRNPLEKEYQIFLPSVLTLTSKSSPPKISGKFLNFTFMEDYLRGNRSLNVFCKIQSILLFSNLEAGMGDDHKLSLIRKTPRNNQLGMVQHRFTKFSPICRIFMEHQ